MQTKTTLAIATVFLLLPYTVHAQSSTDSPTKGQSEAMHLVPTAGALVEDVDAKKNQAGQEVDVKLTQTVRLTDGTKLPVGTLLVGDIAQDDMQVNGQSKVALRFTQAKLKDGNVVPIKATIFGVGARESDPQTQSDRIITGWNENTTSIDEIGAVPHVDLHSKITSGNSGVFVSTDRDDVKLKAGSELGLAIAVVKADSNVSQASGDR
jgi:hypothetical protein